MSLLNPAIVYGLGLAAIPVILHFLMRAKPKKIVFPALRIIRRRKMQNVRRIRLRHIWLLLLRVLVVGVLVAAITRPSLPAASYGLNTTEASTLLGIAAAAAGAYFALMKWWQKQGLANHTINSRRTSLRGGLGVLSVLLFAVLVGWPYQKRVGAEITAPLAEVSTDLPVAGVFLFDTSLSMDYREDSRTRLDVAKAIAVEHLETLPTGSRLAVADSTGLAPILFQADMAGAQERIDKLKVGPLALPLNERLRSALALQEDDRKRTLDTLDTVPADARTDRLVREVYIFTDLSQSAWRASSAKFLRDELERLPFVSVYLIDVGVDTPRNISLTNLKLSREEVTEDSDIVVEADVTSLGFDDESVMVEFHVVGASGQSIKQGESSIPLSDGGGQKVRFMTRATGDRLTRGELRLVTSDPLAGDNLLWFTIGVRPRLRVLIVAPAPDDEESSILDSDATELYVTLDSLGYDVTFAPAHKLETTDLDQVEVVFLVNVPAPSENSFARLKQFVSDGGGLTAFLGSLMEGQTIGIDPVAWNTETAKSFLPGELIAGLPRGEVRGLDVKDTTHPLMQPFSGQGVSAQVALIPVWRFWKVTPAADASAIARFTDPQATPALVERAHGNGRTIFLTTAGNLTFDRRRQWSRLAAEWPFIALVDRMTLYLGHRTGAQLNFAAGEEVLLPLDRQTPVEEYLLRKPGGVQLRNRLAVDATGIRITETDEVGNYQVRGVDSEFTAGFAINPPSEESAFSRLIPADLDNLFGEKRYGVARDIESLTRSVTTGRLGIEIFPLILGLVILVFCLELIVANRFYEADQSPETASRKAVTV